MKLSLAAVTATTCLLLASEARAESCTGITSSGGRFATCFDLGNRLSVTAGSEGFGGSLALRHVVTFEDEPDLVWKLEHQMLDVTHATFEDRFSGALYRGRYVRHARDGHIVIPLGTPKKIFLPFDVGGFAEAGRIEWKPDSTEVRIGVVKTAALFDLSRSRDFRRRIAFGPVAKWEVDADRDEMTLTQHTVSPFTSLIANVRLERANGRSLANFEIEGGEVWHSKDGWKPDLRAEASLEHVVLAVNDRPIAVTLGVKYETATDEVLARVGARVVLFDRRDPRVQLAPLKRR
ncbi:MAG: hypothetical protein H0V17_24920 [Deltaproteobacteria bacterium]|nr:hypothetical protein [Deltaproteobacteria bacterium]